VDKPMDNAAHCPQLAHTLGPLVNTAHRLHHQRFLYLISPLSG
jgi:hypothetical protein